MKALLAIDGTPATGTFWWMAKLAGERVTAARVGADSQTITARDRGSGTETAVLAGLFGLAFLGLTFWLLQGWAGGWAWLLAVPAAFAGLHLATIGAAMLAGLCCRIGLLRVERREIWTGLVLAVGMTVAGALIRHPVMLPWLAFACVEAVAWPARRLWEWTGEDC